MVDMKKVLLTVILIVITFIVIFQFVGTSSDAIVDAADSITDANNCSRSVPPYIYNITDKSCYNGTDTDGHVVYVAGQLDLPLNSLFGSSGVALLVMMAAILLMLIALGLKHVKGKGQE